MPTRTRAAPLPVTVHAADAGSASAPHVISVGEPPSTGAASGPASTEASAPWAFPPSTDEPPTPPDVEGALPSIPPEAPPALAASRRAATPESFVAPPSQRCNGQLFGAAPPLEHAAASHAKTINRALAKSGRRADPYLARVAVRGEREIRAMRILMTVRIPAEAGNRAIKDGTLPKIIGDFMERNKPEAAYFTTVDGERTALFVLTVKASSEMPPISEPLFMGLNANIQFQPVMNADDLKTGLAALR